MLLALLTAALVGALAISLVKRYADQQELDYLTANANAAARQALPLIWPQVSPSQLQQLVQTTAFLGNLRVRIQDTDKNVIVDSGARNGPDTFVWILPPDPGRTRDGEPQVMSIMLGRRRPVRNPDGSIVQQPPGTRYMLVERNDGPWGRRFVFQALTDTPPQDTTTTSSAMETTNRSTRTVSVPIGDDTHTVGFVELSGAPNFGGELTAATLQALIVAAVLASLVAGVVALFVGRGLTAPLKNLALAANRMSRGDLTTRAAVANDDETGQVARQFNEMAERMQSSFTELSAERDTLRRFIADASHELRTPITAIKTFNELLRNGAADDLATRTEFLAESQTQIERLEWITRNLLDLSRLDSGVASMDMAVNDAGEIMQVAAAAYRQSAIDKGVALVVTQPDPKLAVRCDRARIEIVLSNLIDNALKVTPNGGHIDVGAETVNHIVRVSVRDSGAGIDAADLPHIFERFYRGKGSVMRGSGLGLALVKSIVQAHGGRVDVDSIPGQGSRFMVDLPIDAAPRTS
jgi:signal transduction histidine kinase